MDENLIISGEREDDPKLVKDMRLYMPKLTYELSKSLNAYPQKPWGEVWKPEIDDLGEIKPFVDFYLDDYNKVCMIHKNDHYDKEVYQESPMCFRSALAECLDLALLTPAFTSARIALNEFVSKGNSTLKSTALLSLLYCGYRHPQLNEINLYGLIESRFLFEVPLQMLQKILPALKEVFVGDKKSLDLLVSWFGNRMKSHIFNGAYQRADFAIFLAGLEITDSDALYMILEVCLLEWAEWLYPENLNYHSCRIKCVKAVADLISHNPIALDLYVKKIKSGIDTDDDVNDWTNPLLYLHEKEIILDLFPKILSIADALLEVDRYKFYIKAVQVFVNFMHNEKFKIQTRNWILTKLKSNSGDIIRFTLEGITNLDPDDEIKQLLFTYLETNDDNQSKYLYYKNKGLLIKQIVLWNASEAIPLLEKFTQVSEGDDYDVKTLAQKAEQAIKELKKG